MNKVGEDEGTILKAINNLGLGMVCAIDSKCTR